MCEKQLKPDLFKMLILIILGASTLLVFFF